MSNSIANWKCLLDHRREKNVTWWKAFLTVLITKSKNSKWDHYDNLASLGGFREMSALCFCKGMVLHTWNGSWKGITEMQGDLYYLTEVIWVAVRWMKRGWVTKSRNGVIRGKDKGEQRTGVLGRGENRCRTGVEFSMMARDWRSM